MLPSPLENRFEHWPCQASGLGILLTWVIGSEEDLVIGKKIFITMSELHLGRRLYPLKENL